MLEPFVFGEARGGTAVLAFRHDLDDMHMSVSYNDDRVFVSYEARSEDGVRLAELDVRAYEGSEAHAWLQEHLVKPWKERRATARALRTPFELSPSEKYDLFNKAFPMIMSWVGLEGFRRFLGFLAAKSEQDGRLNKMQEIRGVLGL